MRIVIRILDLSIYLALYCIIALCLAVAYLRSLFVKRKEFKERRMLQLMHFAIADIEREGSLHAVYTTDLNGYFENLVTIIFAYRDSRIFDKRAGVHRVINMPQQRGGIVDRSSLNKTNIGLGILRLFLKCVALIREEKISLIRAQDPHILGLAALFASLWTGVPYTIHLIQNYDISTRRVRKMVFPPFIFRTVEKCLEEIILKSALFITTGSINYKFYAISHGANPEKTFAFRMRPSAIHLKEPSLRRDLKAELGIAGKRMLFYAGRLDRVKFPEDIVIASSLVKDRIKDIVLVMAGDGELKSRLECLARELGIEENLIFLGKVPQERLVDLYYSADAILFAHGGVALVEASLSGKPIACYNHDWSSEVFGYNERGLLAPFRDTKGFAENITRLLKDEDLSSSLGIAARKFAAKYFNEKIMVETERSFFEKFLTRS